MVQRIHVGKLGAKALSLLFIEAQVNHYYMTCGKYWINFESILIVGLYLLFREKIHVQVRPIVFFLCEKTSKLHLVLRPFRFPWKIDVHLKNIYIYLTAESKDVLRFTLMCSFLHLGDLPPGMDPIKIEINMHMHLAESNLKQSDYQFATLALVSASEMISRKIKPIT